MKTLLILAAVFLVSCSTPKRKISPLAKSISPTEAINGMYRLTLLARDDVELIDFKRHYKNDFDEKSKKFNPQTSCYEYIAHPYPSLHKPVIVGFDRNEKYVYSVDISNNKPEMRKKILWVRDLKQTLEREVSIIQNSID